MGWLLAIVAGGFLTFNSVVTPDRAAGEAKKALQKQFPDAQIEVKIEGKRGKDVLNGRFRKIDIDLTDLSLDELPMQSIAVLPVASGVASPVVVRQPDGAMKAAEPRQPDSPQFKPVEIKQAKPSRPAKMKLGRTGELNIAVRNLKWQSLPVETANFQFNEVEYDFGALKNRSELKLVRVGKSTMHLELAPEALTPFIAKRVENVINPVVTMSDGQLTVKGARSFYGVSAPFEVNGQPDFIGSEMILKSPKLSVSGVAVPAAMANPLLKSINPLYSFDSMEGMPFRVRLTKVEARNGKLQIDGDLILR